MAKYQIEDNETLYIVEIDDCGNWEYVVSTSSREDAEEILCEYRGDYTEFTYRLVAVKHEVLCQD